VVGERLDRPPEDVVGAQAGLVLALVVKSARPLASPTAYSQPPGTPLARSWSSTST
jgi:hypothetical protein